MSADLNTPIVLALGQSKPYAVTVDSTCVYWTNNGDGTIMMVPMAGGTPTVLAQDYQEAGAIIASNGWLYWSAFRSGSVSKLQVGLSPGQTAAPIPLAEGYFGVGQISLSQDLLSFVVYDGPLLLALREPDRSGIVATV